jgi:choloylglycine hydrolase
MFGMSLRKVIKFAALAGAFVLVFSRASPAAACSWVFWSNNPQAKVVARSMDLYIPDQPKIYVFPKGISRDGKAGENSAKWTSKFGSVIITALDLAVSEGLNEKGLGVHLLYLSGTEYEPLDQLPRVANVLWPQYILDNFQTVEEAVAHLKDFQVVSITALERQWPLHLAIQDASGDSAIIEFLKGKMVVHHGLENRVLTNEPPYEEQIVNLKRYKLFGGSLAMPGDIHPKDRFVRASSYLKTLPEPKTVAEAVFYVLGVIRNVSSPFGALETGDEPTEDIWPTRWVTVMDLTHRVYYFNATTSPNLFRIELDRLKFAKGAPVLALDPQDPTLAGEISMKLRKAKAPFYTQRLK